MVSHLRILTMAFITRAKFFGVVAHKNSRFVSFLVVRSRIGAGGGRPHHPKHAGLPLCWNFLEDSIFAAAIILGVEKLNS